MLGWTIFFDGYGQSDDAENRRPYEHWHHAEELVASSPSEFQRTDVITTLKRAVDSRLRLLNRTYRFKGIPIPGKPHDLLELLGLFGVVRPLLVSELIVVRNRVEHEDVEPPTQDRCRELVEFVWYFIRSTDLLVYQVETGFSLTDPDDWDCRLGFRVQPTGGWVIDVEGWLPPSLSSSTERIGWMRIDVGSSDTAAALKDREGEVGWEPDADRHNDDVYVHGRVVGPGAPLTELLRRYFERA